jgi:hypothetical protein
MRETYGEQGLHKLAHDSTKEEAHKYSEEQWAIAPEPYSSVFSSQKTQIGINNSEGM